MSRFKGRLRGKEWSTVIIDVIPEIIYRCNYMRVFFFF